MRLIKSTKFAPNSDSRVTFEFHDGMHLEVTLYVDDVGYWEALGNYDELLDFPIVAGLREIGYHVGRLISLPEGKQVDHSESSLFFLDDAREEPSAILRMGKDGNPLAILSVQSHPRIPFDRFYAESAKVLASIDAHVVKTEYFDSPQEQTHEITVSWVVGDRTVWQLLNCARIIEMIGWPASDMGRVTAQHATKMIVSGEIDSLLGWREDGQLEAKSALYDIEKTAGRIELAKDVTQFANSPSGGILILGMRTKGDATGDRFSKITPLDIPNKLDQRYRSILDSRVYPAIEGIGIGVIPYEGGKILFITVPPQKDSLKPFLVQGAVIDGEGKDSFFLIPQRQADNVSSVPGRAVHALLAGRLFGAGPVDAD
ncbi:helix-turn-helix domain-containing protein [Streptomyces sp. NRRL S-1813]|uniref:AlbA family DNA-binding domain-containing protein n=1 Tax=Streptomyces sp. NRRL S-1813 TaxID=1463888 RepID=UPI00131D7725|nr:ATP-binding protein [Streptomyces sp. NRRL S-1813]